MRTVTLNTEELSHVSVHNVRQDKFYGALVGDSEYTKAIVMRMDMFTLIDAHLVGYGSTWRQWNSANLVCFMEAAMKDGVRFFEFDTANELYNWLAEEIILKD